MSDIEISTAVTVTSYPKDKVLEKYFLFGGVMGCSGQLILDT